MPEILQTLGLILIIIAWLIQLITIVRKSTKLNIGFVWMYFIGILLFAISNISSDKESAIMNLIVAVLVLLTIIAYQRQKSEKPPKPETQGKEKIE
jgi:thiol:disulfide interchange protein